MDMVRGVVGICTEKERKGSAAAAAAAAAVPLPKLGLDLSSVAPPPLFES